MLRSIKQRISDRLQANESGKVSNSEPHEVLPPPVPTKELRICTKTREWPWPRLGVRTPPASYAPAQIFVCCSQFCNVALVDSKRTKCSFSVLKLLNCNLSSRTSEERLSALKRAYTFTATRLTIEASRLMWWKTSFWWLVKLSRLLILVLHDDNKLSLSGTSNNVVHYIII